MAFSIPNLGLKSNILRKHEIFEFVQEPFPPDSLDVGWCMDVDCHIGEMLICITNEVHKLSTSRLS